MRWEYAGAALLLLEPMGYERRDRVPPRELAQAWGYQVAVLPDGTLNGIKLDRAIWVDGRAGPDDEDRQIAIALAYMALSLTGQPATDAAVDVVASILIEPPRAGPYRTFNDVLRADIAERDRSSARA